MKQVSPTYFPPKQSAGPRCCNTGHPILADPLTGRTMCSCQLNAGVPAYMSRVPSLPETVHSHAPTKVPNGSIVGEHGGSVFYPRYAGDHCVTSLKSPTPTTLHPYYVEQLMATSPYGALFPGFDINGARRKNTNREATGPLKAWIYQHRKNPYPTKGEKVMLAIISQMTLTQVSTWFANARRRLKKESKMDDKDIDLADIDIDDSNILNNSSSDRLADSDSESSANRCNISRSTSEISDLSDCEEPTIHDIKPAKCCAQSLFSPDGRTELYLERISSPSDLSPCSASQTDSYMFDANSKTETDVTTSAHADGAAHSTEDTIHSSQDVVVICAVQPQNKPKIWSIAEMIK